MEIKNTERHERVLYAHLRRGQLDGLIERAVAEESGIPVETIRKHGKVEIEKNMEGSPSYHNGYTATVRATIPLSELGAEVSENYYVTSLRTYAEICEQRGLHVEAYGIRDAAKRMLHLEAEIAALATGRGDA